MCFYDTHRWRVRQNGHQYFCLSLNLTRLLCRCVHSVIRSILLFFIFMCINFMSLYFIRIVWGHNRTNRRPYHNNTDEKKTRPKERERRDKMRREKKNFDAISKCTFIGYEFLFRLFFFFFYYNQSNKPDIILGIGFRILTLNDIADRPKRFSCIPIAVLFRSMLKILSFNHGFIWL